MTRSMEDGAVQSVFRAFALLERMAEGGGEAGISDLAEQIGVALPTAHRLMRTLTGLGYARQLPSRRYALGPALARLGDQATKLFGEWARPALVRLEARVGESANLAVLDGERVVYIGQVPSRHQMRMFTEVGRRVHAHSTGVGKAILSQLDDALVERIVAGSGMERHTDTTLATIEDLMRDLAVTRERGYAIDEGEQEVGVRCFAVPVSGTVSPTAVSVSGPSARVSRDREQAILAALRGAAQELTQVLGG